MWVLKKSVKIKTAILDAKNKPVYEQREGGEPCPEASAWSKPELWCREVSDGSSDAQAALSAYKQRTGHDLGSYVPTSQEQINAVKKVELLKKLNELKGLGAVVEFSESDMIVILMKKVESAEKSLANPAPSTTSEGNSGEGSGPAEGEGNTGENNAPKNDVTDGVGDGSDKTDEEDFDIDV